MNYYKTTSTQQVRVTNQNQLIEYSEINKYQFIPSSFQKQEVQVQPPSNNFQQIIVNHLEVTTIIFLIFTVVSLLFQLKQQRRRNKVLEEKIKRKDSSMSDDSVVKRFIKYIYSRKESYQENFSQQAANSQSRSNSNDNENGSQFQVLGSTRAKKDEGNSTDSSPVLSERNRDKDNFTQFQNSLSQEDKSSSMYNYHVEILQFRNNESIPQRVSSEEQKQRRSVSQKDSEQKIKQQRNSNSNLKSEIVPYGQSQMDFDLQTKFQENSKRRIIKERKVEIQQDDQKNTINLIETQTIITEFKKDENNEALNNIESVLQNQAKQRKQSNQGKEIKYRGIRHVETNDIQSQKVVKTLHLLTEWSKFSENGKFSNQYKIIEQLGKGAFGQVYKVQKLLDQKFYAVKRIYFQMLEDKQFTQLKIYREIEALQNLFHPNIVKYNTYWLEEPDIDFLQKISTYRESIGKKSLQNTPSQSKSESKFFQDDSNNFDFVQFQNDDNQASLRSSEFTPKRPSKESEFESSFQQSEINSSVATILNKLQFNPKHNPHILILNIEMELCEQRNLRDFIEVCDRNTQGDLIKDIFVQIVRGVEYIHSQNFIHRDLKPANIFLTSSNQVRIGDLGLTIKDNDYLQENYQTSQVENISLSKTSQVGTAYYMSPEIRNNNSSYNNKTDIYSLGIILFEMLWKIKTTQERHRLIKELSDNRVLPPQLSKTFKEEYQLILKMTQPQADKRPSAQEILQLYK